jgi:hypothetical protein
MEDEKGFKPFDERTTLIMSLTGRRSDRRRLLVVEEFDAGVPS